ncbi:signal recognition particle-docking protein FtsY [Amphritea pacifica]|uniref:signal recognition particle-docking protein FtsY n=1 Tax=Amphritea pacifica TaxID=2811233 RepID=UPI0019654CA2|nr:signal recognition particle-docking protein FtsY [Amphritea pacifica]MBN1008192.1 signal recognition particle-docking protein FtsY [Amphritea pacifica]
MFKKLKSIFSSEKDDTQKALPEEDGVQTAVTEQPLADSSDLTDETVEETVQEQAADAVVVARETADKQQPETPVQQEAASEPTTVEAESVNDTESEPEAESGAVVELPSVVEPATAEAEVKPEQKTGFFGRIKAGLSRTKANLTEGLGDLFLGAKQIDDELLEEIETQLLLADVGVEATTEIIGKLTERVKRKQLADADALYTALKDELASLLETVEKPIDFSQSKGPFMLLMVGVNGVGKTTTIGKLAKKYQADGKSVMLAAGDTFRAAAVEQLQVWGERNNVPVVAQHTGADSASVLYDALQSAQAKNIDVLIADTAGRLQNKDNLMQELEKVVRVMKKLDPEAPHEVMLVLDAGTGQNAMSQAKLFKEAVGVSGISLTKLDGTAKGGIIFAIAKQLDLPIRYIGVGEKVDDLRPFKAKEFVTALFD